MPGASIPENEADRLRALYELQVLDQPAEEHFDALTRAAALVCGTPISLISLIDADRQWFKSAHGLDHISETPREQAFCGHAILQESLMEVADATEDPRFADNPLVINDPKIRFYAGAPLVLSGGERVGTLCVIDRAPRILDDTQKALLAELAAAAAEALQAQRTIRSIYANGARLQLISDELAATDQHKNAFLATLAHELRNILTPLDYGLQIIKLDAQLSPASEKQIPAMQRQIAHMGYLVNDLMDVAQIGAGLVTLNRETVDIKQLLEEVVEDAQSSLQSDGHQLIVTTSEGPMPVFVDPPRLQQIFGNLIANATKYTPAGGQITLTADATEKSVDVCISDTGIGMSAEEIDGIFELFAQTNGGRDHKVGGLGIGLSVVRQLVALHGGSVTAASAGPGEGSSFTVTLPLCLRSTQD